VEIQYACDPEPVNKSYLGFWSIKGKVVDSVYENNNLYATSMVTDPETIADIKQGKLHSYSIHVEVAHTIDGLIRRIVDQPVELTMTKDPVDSAARFTKMKEVVVNVAMANDKSQLDDESQPPETEAKIVSQKGGNYLSDKQPEQTEQPQDASGAEQVTEVRLSREAQERMEALEQQNKELMQSIEIMAKKARAEEIVREVKSWVKNGNLPPAAEEKTRDFMMGLGEEGANLFREIVRMNQIGTLGEVEIKGEASGMVRNAEQPEKVKPVIDFSTMPDEVFETILNSWAADVMESRGFYGNEAVKKHLEKYTMNLYPLRGEE